MKIHPCQFSGNVPDSFANRHCRFSRNGPSGSSLIMRGKESASRKPRRSQKKALFRSRNGAGWSKSCAGWGSSKPAVVSGSQRSSESIGRCLPNPHQCQSAFMRVRTHAVANPHQCGILPYIEHPMNVQKINVTTSDSGSRHSKKFERTVRGETTASTLSSLSTITNPRAGKSASLQ